jgi:5,10-methylenetetrahydromethanopterin reductase
MRIGVFIEDPTVDTLVGLAQDAADRGFPSVWTPQVFGVDAVTALAVVAREVPSLDLGTAVIPTYSRHPMTMAAQALTLQQISGGRFSLGIGLSHQFVIEHILGMSFDKPVRHLREYLSILLPLVRGEASSFSGEVLTGNLALNVPTDPVPVLVAALGSQTLRVTGSRAEGTVTWMTGPDTISSHVAPTLHKAAADAGRPEPRVVAALPVAVTDDPDAAREAAGTTFSIYGQLPSYRAMLDREGASGPADVAIVGSPAEVRAGIERIVEAGATEFVVVPFHNRHETLDAAAELLG